MAKRPLDLRRRALADLASDTLFVVIYCRVSTEQQAAPEKTSLDLQEAACRVRATEMARRENKRLQIVKVCRDEGVSGTVPPEQRPAMAQALEYARAGHIHVLLSFTDDRFARLMVHGMTLVDALEKVGVRYAVCDADYLYDEHGKMLPESRLTQVMKQYFAEVERKRILEKTDNGRRKLAEKGVAPIRSRFPIGYIIRRKWEVQAGRCTPEEIGKYVIVPEQAEIIREMFQRMASGGSLRAVVRWLQDDLHLPTASGSKTWAARTVQRIITDPLYKGIGRYGVTVRKIDETREEDGLKKHYYVPAAPERITTFPVPPIVTPDLWQAANDQLLRNRNMQSGAPDVRYLLSGFLRCADCGGAMCGHQGNSSSRVRYYQCVRRNSDRRRANHDETPRCTFPYIQCNAVESLVGRTLAETVLRQSCLSAAITRFQSELSATHSSGSDGLTERRESLTRQREIAEKAHQSAQVAIERILLLDPDHDISRFVIAAKQHRERRDALTQQLSELETAGANPAIERLLSMDANALAAYVCEMLSRLPEVVDSPVLSPTEKRFMLDSAVTRIVPRNETPHKQRNRKWGIEIELRQSLIADAIAQGSAPATGDHSPVAGGIPAYGAQLWPQLRYRSPALDRQ